MQDVLTQIERHVSAFEYEEAERLAQSIVPPTEALTDEQLRAELIRLKTALQDYNATVIGSALSVLKSGCGDSMQDVLTQIERHVSAFEYEEAERLADRIFQSCEPTPSDRSEQNELT